MRKADVFVLHRILSDPRIYIQFSSMKIVCGSADPTEFCVIATLQGRDYPILWGVMVRQIEQVMKVKWLYGGD